MKNGFSVCLWWIRKKLMQEEWRIKDNALAEEVEAKEPYVRAFVDFLLGNVIKCASVDELRQCKIGVTADCLLYQSYQLRRLNPDNYKKYVYIGEKSKKQRQKELAVSLEKLEQDRAEYKERETEARNILAQEFLNDTVEEYQNLILDLSEKKEKEKQKIKTEKEDGRDRCRHRGDFEETGGGNPRKAERFRSEDR